MYFLQVNKLIRLSIFFEDLKMKEITNQANKLVINLAQALEPG